MKVTLLALTLNEIEGVKAILPAIDPSWCDQLIVVDGGSKDGTIEWCREHGYEVYVQKRKGIRFAYLEVLPMIKGDVILCISPDGNCPVAAIPQLLDKMAEGYDLVIGSRYLGDATSDDDDVVTGFGNWLFTRTVNLLHGGNYTDAMVIYRAFTRQLVYDLDLATNVGASVEMSSLASLFVITATVKDGVDPDRVEREMDAVVNEFLKQGPTEAELQRARSRIQSDFTRGAERLGGFGGRSDILAESMTFDGRPDGYLERLQRVATSTGAEVRATGQKWLEAPSYTLLVSPYPALKPGQSSLDRTVVPPLGEPPDVTFPKVQRATLSNGLKVMLLERHSSALVNVALAVDAGFAADSAEKAGTASLALDLLDDGTTTRDTFKIADELDAIGARITTGSSLDLSFVRLQALSNSLAPALAIYADVVLRPSFPQAMVDLAKKRRLAQIGQEKATPVQAATRTMPALLYGASHGYGNPLSGSGFERTVSTVTRDDLASWHRSWFQPGSATLIVTGDTTLAAVVPELEKAFSAWKAGKAPAKRVAPVSATAGGRVYLIDRPGAPQSVILAGHVSEPGGQPEDLAIDTVMRNFGGLATSRLNRNLRLDKHWSYGTQGLLQDARGQRPLFVLAPVQTDKTKESVAEVIKELGDIAGARPIRGEEFASIMRTQTLGLPGRWATLQALEAAAIQIVNYGYPDDYFSTYASRVRGLREGELDAAARKFIRPSQILWVIVGDLSQIEKGIRELNLGTVTVVDAS